MEWIGDKMDIRVIDIRISDACNFNCKYCNEHNTMKKKYITLNEYKIIIEKLELLYTLENKKQNILLWGGEPLLNPDLKEILEYTLDQKFIEKITVHSNFSIRNDKVLDFIVQNDIKCFSSIHLDYFYSQKIKDNFVHNLDEILKTGNLLEINLMFQRFEEFDKCKAIKKELKRYPINIAPTTQLLNKYNKKTKLLLTITGEYLSNDINTSNGYTNYIDIFDIDHRGFMCDTTINNLIINTNGDIFLCQSSFYTNHTSGNIFNYSKEDFNILKRPLKCIHKTCVCGHTLYKEREKLEELESKYSYNIFTKEHIC